MTRKDYELIASVFNDQMRLAEMLVIPSTEAQRVEKIIINLSGEFQRANPRFNSERFMRACGMTD